MPDLAPATPRAPRLEALEDRVVPTFSPAVTYIPGSGPTWAAVADLNHDGNLDIATSDYGSNTASILFGNGDGTFRPAVHYNTHGNSQGIAAGDFTGSGRLDLAVSNFNTSNVDILLNNGDGTFRNAGTVACGAAPSSPPWRTSGVTASSM